MFSTSLKDHLLGNQYIGIELFSSSNAKKAAILLVEKKKEELIIVKKDRQTFSDSFIEKLEKKIPYYLVINTNQVIHKEISDIDASDNKLLHKVFPNLKWEEFYYEIWRLKSKSIIAISRKSYVNDIVLSYQKQKIDITGISLGICSLSGIYKYTSKEEIATNHQNISFNPEKEFITNRESAQITSYDINGLHVQNSHILAFSGLIRLVLPADTTTNLIDFNSELYDDFNQKSFFSKGVRILVYSVLIVLLINFFAFNYFFKKAEETSEKLLLNSSSIEEVSKTKERVKIKEEKLKSVLSNAKTTSSYIVNELTKMVPNSILLEELDYLPLEKKIKSEEPIITQKNTIVISGTTLDNQAVTKWIEDIQKLNFTQKVIITHFGRDEENKTVFSIKIILRENEIK